MMDPADPDLEPLRKLTCSLINSAFPDKVATAKNAGQSQRQPVQLCVAASSAFNDWR